MSSRTEQDTWSPPAFHVTVHRPGQPSPKSRPCLPASTDTGTRSCSHAARCDHNGSAAAAPTARPALRGLSLRTTPPRESAHRHCEVVEVETGSNKDGNSPQVATSLTI